MPNGKPAGVRCLQLSDDNLCLLFGDPSRPAFCAAFKASPGTCGESAEEALKIITDLETQTSIEPTK